MPNAETKGKHPFREDGFIRRIVKQPTGCFVCLALLLKAWASCPAPSLHASRSQQNENYDRVLWVRIEFPTSYSFRRVTHLEMTNGQSQRQQLDPLQIQVQGPLKHTPVARESLQQACSCGCRLQPACVNTHRGAGQRTT